MSFVTIITLYTSRMNIFYKLPSKIVSLSLCRLNNQIIIAIKGKLNFQ
jgi:hypothetical protein